MTPLTLYHKNKIEYVHVPCDFIDRYLLDAPGEFVKIYLYLLRCMEVENSSLSLSDMADKLNFTENDVMRALKYWEKKNLLSLIYNEEKLLCGVDFSNTVSSEDRSVPAEDPMPSGNQPIGKDEPDTKLSAHKKSVVDPQKGPALTTVPKKHYTKTKLSALVENPEAKQMLFIAEQYLGTSFNPTEIETLLYIYDSLGFSLDLIEYLLGVCIEKQITSLSRIEEVAVDWFRKDITTVKEAKKSNSIQRKTCQAVCGALGIEGRTLTDSEQMFLLKWTGTYGFSLDFILEACHRTIQATGKPSFQYTDTILKNWQKAGVISMADIQTLDAAHQAAQPAVKRTGAKPRTTAPKSKGSNFPERSYDYSALEQQLLNI